MYTFHDNFIDLQRKVKYKTKRLLYAIYTDENHRIFRYNSTTQISNYRFQQIFKLLNILFCKLSITLVTRIIVTIEQR